MRLPSETLDPVGEPDEEFDRLVRAVGEFAAEFEIDADVVLRAMSEMLSAQAGLQRLQNQGLVSRGPIAS